MKHQKIGTSARKNAGPGLLGGSPDHVAENGSNCNLKAALNATSGSGVRRVLSADHGHFLEGNPKVVVEPRASAIFVGLTTIPWGWQSKGRTCEFYNASSADKYATKLVAMLDAEGAREQAARQRKLALRLQEREAAR